MTIQENIQNHMRDMERHQQDIRELHRGEIDSSLFTKESLLELMAAIRKRKEG